MRVLSQILPCLPQTGRKLSPFQMLLLTLMHLRLNLPIQHMAHLFCIDRSTVSTTFTNTIDVMFTHLAASNPPAVLEGSLLEFSPVSFMVFPHAGLQGALHITFPTITAGVRATPGAVLSGASRDICLTLY
ncbi:hypothetical protein GOODEAATRI_020987 [Goodea atripinnis]|uniref:Transposase Helix-turn-helix domain-containing protein n=1 Tax=Goodea atripinnis TaxID=208336 RepID=A0ABV0MJH1_9TELE